MNSPEQWDWETAEKTIPFGQWSDMFDWVEEPYVSPDGERIAAIVRMEDGAFGVCVNGRAWEQVFDKIWHLRFSPDGRLTALAFEDMQWSAVVDGRIWTHRFDFAWQPEFSHDGRHLVMAFQNQMQYGLAVDDVPWERRFNNLTHLTVAPSGRSAAAVVQIRGLEEGGIFDFESGAYTVSVDGRPWDAAFMNAWGLAFSSGGDHVAAEVRLTRSEYTIAEDGRPWDARFDAVWEPAYNPSTHEVTAPVKQGDSWTLAGAHGPVWRHRFAQCWHHRYSADGAHVAAIVAPTFGKWTVSVDDHAWPLRASGMIMDLTFSPDGTRVAASANHKGRWHLIADGTLMSPGLERVWAPVFSPDSRHVAAKADMGSYFTLAVDDSLWDHRCDHLWDPVFSPDSRNVLVRSIENGIYHRRIIPVSQV